jgi:hypothetical protein
MSPRWALEELGISEQRPTAKRLHAMFGNVNSNKLRRPYVSIVQIAGQAKMKLIRPKPNEANRAVLGVAPASKKIVDE